MKSIDEFIGREASASLSCCIAKFLGQASGHQISRHAIKKPLLEWLQIQSRQCVDISLKSAAAVALVKITRGSLIDNNDFKKSFSTSDEEKLANMLATVIVEELSGQSSLSDAVEGLAYLTINPRIKQSLANDSRFLTRLLSLVPHRRDLDTEHIDSTIIYGILVIIGNISFYRPQRTQEDAQVDRLKRLADSGGDIEDKSDHLDDEQHVVTRCKQLIDAGVLDVLASSSGLASLASRQQTGRIFLSLTEDKSNRGKILQSGGVRALTRLIRQSLSTAPNQSSPADMMVADLFAIQALSKLTITASPISVFGPEEGAMLDAVRPFASLLLYSSATLLQQFETMMALINLSSHSPTIATKIGAFDGLMSKVEVNLLESNHLVRRAAMELICNLIAGSDLVYDAYGGSEQSKGAKNHIHILLAMCNVDDLATQMAASGALATLTTAPNACRILWDLRREKVRVLLILAQLIDPSLRSESDGQDEQDEDEQDKDDAEILGHREPYSGLVHRGIICLRNFLSSEVLKSESRALAMEATSMGLSKALVQLIKSGGDQAVVEAAAEVLKYIIDQLK